MSERGPATLERTAVQPYFRIPRAEFLYYCQPVGATVGSAATDRLRHLSHLLHPAPPAGHHRQRRESDLLYREWRCQHLPLPYSNQRGTAYRQPCGLGTERVWSELRQQRKSEYSK